MLTLDTDTGIIAYNITFDVQLLLGPEFAAHVHGPALPDQSAGVVFMLPPGNPKVGESFLEPSAIGEIINGLFYVNIHTDEYPNGEIRGQILVPEASTFALTLFGLLMTPIRAR